MFFARDLSLCEKPCQVCERAQVSIDLLHPKARPRGKEFNKEPCGRFVQQALTRLATESLRLCDSKLIRIHGTRKNANPINAFMRQHIVDATGQSLHS